MGEEFFAFVQMIEVGAKQAISTGFMADGMDSVLAKDTAEEYKNFSPNHWIEVVRLLCYGIAGLQEQGYRIFDPSGKEVK